MVNSLPVSAQGYGEYDYSGSRNYGSNENKNAFGLRFGGYTFSDADNQDWYGDDAASVSLDVTIPGENPNISWRLALDGVSSSVALYDGTGDYIRSDLALGGFSGAVIFHNNNKETVGVYGGIGLGLYNVTEKGSAVILGTPVIIDWEGSGMGFNLFAGINARLGDSFAIGLEYFIRSLDVNLTDNYYGGSDTYDYGGNSALLTFEFKF